MNTRIFPSLVSILPPSVFLLYLYQRNAVYLSIWHVLVAIAIFTTGAVILHLVVSKLVKSSGVAALITNILWILFFMIKAPYLLIKDSFAFDIRAVYASIMAVITIIVIFLIIRYKNKLQKQEIYKVLFVFWAVVFMLNAVPSLGYAINSNIKYTGDDKNYKTEFTVDTSLPSPNIYWLLMDGMLGFKAMEHLFNDSQPVFTAQLTERGFVINREAQFEALHATVFGIPVLMSPHYYDTLFLPTLRNEDILDYKKKAKLRNSIGKFKKSTTLARIRNEFISALDRKGYRINAINYDLTYLIHDNCYYYYIKSKINKGIVTTNILDNIGKLFSLKELLYRTTVVAKLDIILNPLIEMYLKHELKVTAVTELSADICGSFFGNSYQGNDRWHLGALYDIMDYSDPKFVIIHDMKPHCPFSYDEYGKLIKRSDVEKMDPNNYPPQHYFAGKIVIAYIDYILNRDSEAIIILQSDHGLHSDETRGQLITKYGKNDEDVLIMQNQTISAVRIPQKWGGLDQPIEPPNITRLLVNRYVGENYTLLSSDEIIK
jgi:hypothetical protein